MKKQLAKIPSNILLPPLLDIVGDYASVYFNEKKLDISVKTVHSWLRGGSTFSLKSIVSKELEQVEFEDNDAKELAFVRGNDVTIIKIGNDNLMNITTSKNNSRIIFGFGEEINVLRNLLINSEIKSISYAKKLILFKKTGWECIICTFENKENTICNICNSYRQIHCNKCTFINNYDNMECLLCESSLTKD